ncbi:hypothetical protein MM236_04415 [Belliella sp. DSM 107340]|uniref:Uncharacterized protein n=1 Tax=Belliella calami TaxID=2923436 RepID=A0ABS9UKR2_9BACT|nr:hypothetical protein [Belliella calami]MCH7397217.1 hypothetical protein [Belliella calami]
MDKFAVQEAFVEIERTFRLTDIQIKFLQEIVVSLPKPELLEVGDFYIQAINSKASKMEELLPSLNPKFQFRYLR